MKLILLTPILWILLGAGITALIYEQVTLTITLVILISVYVVITIIVNFIALSRYAKTRINK